MEIFKVNTKWNRTSASFSFDNYNRGHEVTFSGNQVLKNSAAPAYKGDENMANPEELLASAVSSCHMLTFLAVASKSGYVVDHYEDDAIAVLDKNSNDVMCVTEINLHPSVKFLGEKIPDAEKLSSMHDKAHRNCFIANSVSCQVNIVH
jgi:organic hydroperoxide reductase OsmC/OhrA